MIPQKGLWNESPHRGKAYSGKALMGSRSQPKKEQWCPEKNAEISSGMGKKLAVWDERS